MKKTYLAGRAAYYFESRFFELDGRAFEIIGTRSSGLGVHDAIHTVKSLQTGARKDIAMADLIDIFVKNKLVDG